MKQWRLMPLAGLISVAFAAAPQDPLAVQLPVLEAMPEAESAWVGEKMAMNGIALSTRTFKISRPPEQVLDYYRSRWKSRGLADIAETATGDYQTLGMEQQGFYQTVQVKAAPGGGSEGILTVTLAPSRVQPNKTTAFPYMLNTEIISKLESLDGGVRAETLTMTNNRSVEANAQYIAAQLTDAGWQAQAFADASVTAQGRILYFQKDQQHCQVTITSQAPDFPGRTLILVHWVKN